MHNIGEPEFELSNPEQIRMPRVSHPLDLNDSTCRRVIAIGDVHGCFDELYELMNRLAPLPGEDLVVFLGDLVDRGPKSSAVVAYVKYLCETLPGFFCVLGNHCEKLVRHRRHEVQRRLNPAYRNPMKVTEERAEEYALVSDAEVLWLSKQPAVIYTVGKRERVFTHAGLIEPKGKPWQYALTQPMDGLIRNRYLRRRQPRGAGGQVVVDLGWEPAPCVRGPGGKMLQPPGSINWDEIWTGPRVIYGHAVHDLETPRIRSDCFGIDTGCCFGGRLTAYVENVQTGEVRFEQVQAKKAYSNRDGGDVE
jgi:hypothetical protein